MYSSPQPRTRRCRRRRRLSNSTTIEQSRVQTTIRHTDTATSVVRPTNTPPPPRNLQQSALSCNTRTHLLLLFLACLRTARITGIYNFTLCRWRRLLSGTTKLSFIVHSWCTYVPPPRRLPFCFGMYESRITQKFKRYRYHSITFIWVVGSQVNHSYFYFL